MAQQIPGVPEGWELVAIRKTVKGDWYLDGYAKIGQWTSDEPSPVIYDIIRKIEKPARYRQFANAEEYLPHWGKPIRLKNGVGFDSVVSTSRIGVYVLAGTSIIRHEMADAFKQFEFADGTPFGVRIDGE